MRKEKLKQLKQKKKIISLDKKQKLEWRGKEFHSTEEMTVDIKGKRRR